MKKYLKTRKKYLRHSKYWTSESVSHVVNLIYFDRKAREFSTSNPFNNPTLVKYTKDNPLGHKNIDVLAAETQRAVEFYDDFNKGVDLYKDE